MLTRDNTWINPRDMISKFSRLPEALPNEEQRAQVNQYFRRVLVRNPTADERREAAWKTIQAFPALIDAYIKLQEEDGDRAAEVSAGKVEETRRALVEQIQTILADLQANTEFYERPWTTYDECLERVRYFKAYIEDNDGYKLLNRDGKGFSKESEVHLAFGLVWCGSEFDVNREVNNGRVPSTSRPAMGPATSRLLSSSSPATPS